MRGTFLAVLLATSAGAKTAGHVKAELYTTGSRSALHLVHAKHWHTYWSNPGDSGLATKVSAGTILWPAPERIVAGPLTSFGYSGDIWLAVDGAPAKLTVDWLECADVCVPGRAELTAVPARHAAVDAAYARVPALEPWAARGASRRGSVVVLELDGRQPLAEFFPAEPGAFEGARGAVAVSPSSTELIIAKAPGAPDVAVLKGILVRPGVPPVRLELPVASGGEMRRNLLLAFLGGLLLNLMPCVFPVLSIKVLGLIARADEGAGSARLHALAYTAGVVASFLALAGALLAARGAGGALGWGFHLQSPWIVGASALLFAAIGLNLLGFFEVGTRLMSYGNAGGGGAFTSGVFAVVVAAPCTAPFMGAALGWALGRPAAEALPVFASLGLGTAAPYALLATWPALLKRLPRPGPWMITLKTILSAPMFAASFWLLWVLWRLLAAPAVADPLWKPWSEQAVRAARADKTVFVDFTAAWCLSCQVNERLVLSRPEVKAALAKGAAFKADWTDKNAAIEAELARHGRAGVPLYIVYPRGGDAVTLPEILTPGLVLETLGERK